jgi:hypothetical protein
MIEAKFRRNLERRLGASAGPLLELSADQARFEATPVDEFVDRLVER